MKKYGSTKKELFNTVIDIVNESNHPNKDEIVERLYHEIELISKKSSKSEEKIQQDKKIQQDILHALSDGKKKTVMELQVNYPNLSITNGLSSSKVTAMLVALINENKVLRTVEHNRSRYSIITV